MRILRRLDPQANRRRTLGFLLLILSWLGALATANAHDPGLSTALLLVGPNRIQASLGFSIVDSRQLADSAGSPNGQISESESADLVSSADWQSAVSPNGIRQSSGLPIRDTADYQSALHHRIDAQQQLTAKMERLARSALELKVDGRQVVATSFHCSFDAKCNADLELEFPLHGASKLVVRSKWPGLLPAGHREFLSVRTTDGRLLAERLLSATTDTVSVETGTVGSRRSAETNQPSFVGFLLMGVMHIWTGYDHLLFLFGLLIVTRSFPAALKIITCFTIAHSITLGIATLRLVPFSSRIVEPLIAASIVYVGIENLARGNEPKGRWLLTFAFGLIHGFGFASALRELGVGNNGGGIIVPLVSFNLGVEAGQMVVAGLFLPIIWKLQKNPTFILRWVPVCSTAVVLLGTFWFVQRVWF